MKQKQQMIQRNLLMHQRQKNQMIQLLKVQRRSFCCVTNHGSVGGWVRQYNACRRAGVKAIFGMEAYVNNYRGDDPELKKKNRSANHLVVLAKNKTGFDNIIRIHSLNPASMAHHVTLYAHLMRGRSPLSRVQREMIAVAVSAANDCYY